MPETAESQDQANLNDDKQIQTILNELLEIEKAKQKKETEEQQKQEEQEKAAETEDSAAAAAEEKSLQDSVERENVQHEQLVTELQKTNETLSTLSEGDSSTDLLQELRLANENLQTVIENQSTTKVYQENSFGLGTLAFAGLIVSIGAYAAFKACGFIVSKITNLLFR